MTGSVSVQSGRRQIGVLADGDCFGETSYVRGARRTATISATTPVTLVSVSSTLLEQVVVGLSAAIQQGVPAVADRAAAGRRDPSTASLTLARSAFHQSSLFRRPPLERDRLGRFGPLQQNLDLLLGFLQRRLALPREPHAALELLERLLERQVAAFESRRRAPRALRATFRGRRDSCFRWLSSVVRDGREAATVHSRCGARSNAPVDSFHRRELDSRHGC